RRRQGGSARVPREPQRPRLHHRSALRGSIRAAADTRALKEIAMHRTALVLLSTVLGVTSLAGAARAQSTAGIQMTPDSRRYLISKDVGAERWAISFNLADRTVTGNVFKTDGSAPSFIWCNVTSETPNTDPRQTSYTLDCFGADAC